ncbi:MAG: hypothetical protein ACRBBQ_12630 [Cognatishimia sp.]
MSRNVQPAPNFTNAFLVMALVNLLWIFLALWAIWGLAAVLAVSAALNAAINRLRRNPQ